MTVLSIAKYISALLITCGIFVLAIEPSFGQSTKPASTTAAKSRPKPVPPKETREEIESGIAGDQIRLIEFANRRLDHLRGTEINCTECFASTAGGGSGSTLDKASPTQICNDKWNDFYSKDVVDVSFVFGYEDYHDDAVSGDTIRRQAMIRKILEPCHSNNRVRACGFKVTDDADVFETTVIGPTGKDHTMRLRLTASSYSTSDRVNRLYPDEQAKASENAARVFYDGLKTADMLLYIGHARDGGGPDFAPAIRKNGKIDYDGHYRVKKPGLERLTKELLAARKSPKILGFLACDSERWSTSMKNLAPKSGLILSATPTIPMEAAVAQAYLALDSVMWQRCEDGFNKAVSQLKEYAKQPILPLKLDRFYDAN